MKKTTAVFTACFAFTLILWTQSSFASGIFTIRGKLKGFTEELYLIETKSLVYEIKEVRFE